MSRPRFVVPALLVLLLVTLATRTALAYDPITWRTHDGGGVTRVSAGGYTLGGTIGQPDAGALVAGPFTLRGGFWLGGAGHSVDAGGAPPVARTFRLFQTRPNPVRASSRVTFDLPRASRAVLAVYDLSGRAVRRWDFGVLAPGRYERNWSATDEGGRALASGVYFLRLDADRDRGVQRVLVVR